MSSAFTISMVDCRRRRWGGAPQMRRRTCPPSSPATLTRPARATCSRNPRVEVSRGSKLYTLPSMNHTHSTSHTVTNTRQSIHAPSQQVRKTTSHSLTRNTICIDQKSGSTPPPATNDRRHSRPLEVLLQRPLVDGELVLREDQLGQALNRRQGLQGLPAGSDKSPGE